MQITAYNLQRVQLNSVDYQKVQITSSTFQNAKAELQTISTYFVCVVLPLLPAGVVDMGTSLNRV